MSYLAAELVHVVNSCWSALFEGALQSLLTGANPAAAGSQPASTASSLQPADKYSAIADLESVFSSTSISSGFGFQSSGVNWTGGGAGVGGGVWGSQTTPYNTESAGQPVNLGQTMPQMFAVNTAQNSTGAPPSYAAVAGN